jgi:thymidylate synthase (FAD)
MNNKVELLGHYGGDLTHALSGWSSTERELTPDKRARIGSFLGTLARAGHHTPFEKSMVHFLVTCDTASHIHLIKHRIGVSINGESARYKELKEDKWLTPEDWPEDIKKDFQASIFAQYIKYHQLLMRLKLAGVSRKRAKESARFMLPYANQTVMDVSFNFRSFMHFQGLRNKPEAQLEIQEIAAEMLELVRGTGEFDLSLEAFGYGKQESSATD